MEVQKIHLFAVRALAGALIAFSTLIAATPVFAQQPNAAESDFIIDEIVVESQRRAESQQDVPITLFAFDSEALRLQQNNTSFGIADYTPGLQIHSSYYGRAPVIFIRGVGINDVTQNFNGPVSIYFDEVFMSSTVGNVHHMFDLERAEVLKGPQGTLFGKNTTGGAILLTSRLPGNEFEADARVTVGKYDQLNIEGGMSVPIVDDKLSARVSFRTRDRDGHLFNVFDQQDDGRINAAAARGILRFTPNEAFEANLILSYSRSRSDESQKKPRQWFPAGPEFDLDGDGVCDDPLTGVGCVDAFGFSDDQSLPFTINSNQDAFSDIDTFGATLNMTWNGSTVGVKSITAYHEADHAGLEDVATDPGDIIPIRWGSDFWQFSQELHLYSNSAGRLQWLTGVHFQHEDLHTDNTFFLGFLPLTAIGFPSPDFDGLFLADNPIFDQKVDSIAVFGDATYNFTDRLALTGGLRFTYEERSMDPIDNVDAFDGMNIAPSQVVDLGIIDDVPQANADWDQLTFRMVADYQVREDFLAYASFSKGFKTGGFPGDSDSVIGFTVPFDPEKLYAWEGGFKSDLFDRRVRLNASAYYYDYRNKQETVIVVLDDGTRVSAIDNASSAEIFGIDWEFIARPSREHDLQFEFGGSWLAQAEFDDFTDGCVDPFSGAMIDCTGNQLQSAPDVNLNFAVQYGTEIGSRGYALFRLDGFYNSNQFFDNTNNPLASSLGGHAELNIHAEYQGHDGRWSIAVFGQNIADETYPTDVFTAGLGFQQITYNVPARWGIQFGANF